MTAPFVDATYPEVMARIVFRMCEHKWRKHRATGLSGAEVVHLVVLDLDPYDGSLLHSCAIAAFFAVVKGIRLQAWRDGAIAGSRLGKGFRLCWYGEYKANRRDPRVTNRGVRRLRSS